MKSLYLIDYENVGNTGILIISEKDIKIDDNIVICLRTDECLNKDCLKILNDYKCNFQILKTNINRKNSVDFLISCFLTDNIDNYEKCYIISNDKGFETVKEYLKNYKNKEITLYNIKEKNSINEILDNKIVEFIDMNYKEEKSNITNILEKNKKFKNISSRKNHIHNDLVNKYGNKGLVIYSQIKNFI